MVQREKIEQGKLPFFGDEETQNIVATNIETQINDTTSTFLDNLSQPIHRWFRYSAGFSAQWVGEVIEKEKKFGRHRVLDPFAGSGTVPLVGDSYSVEAIGVESHPFVSRLAKTKLYWQQDAQEFKNYALSLLSKAKTRNGDTGRYPQLIKRCFPDEQLSKLETIQQEWEAIADRDPLSELTWLTLASILRVCSPVGTAQWQYVLPNKTKNRVFDSYEAFEMKINLMSEDLKAMQSLSDKSIAHLYEEDARELKSVPEGWADLVITSPPYANNYDYADAVRLEMCFFGDINTWGDLQETVRKYLIRACTQHVAKFSKETYKIVADPLLAPIQQALVETCKQLEVEKNNHGGKKIYHTMIATYFYDMAQVWRSLHRVTSEKALICFVVGDSAPYGIHVPVDRWLGELAIAAGFSSYTFEKTRDRNVKWKNRKHTVPLHEGRLWVQG